MKALWTVLALLAFGGVIAWAMSQQSGAECEVCVTYLGATDCRTARAPTEEDALSAAQNTACGILSGSMTRELACIRTPPVSASCGG